MLRKIEVRAGAIRIIARIRVKNRLLGRDEIERLRDDLADNLQDAVSNLRYVGVPRNRVVVK